MHFSEVVRDRELVLGSAQQSFGRFVQRRLGAAAPETASPSLRRRADRLRCQYGDQKQHRIPPQPENNRRGHSAAAIINEPDPGEQKEKGDVDFEVDARDSSEMK